MAVFGYLFPGQGAQKKGMGKEFYDTFRSAANIFDRADQILKDCSVKGLCFEADESELRKTENTQPALFTVSYAIYRVLVEEGFKGSVFAGHSLGEYTAAVAAGFINFEQALPVVRKRGLLMRSCDPQQKGGMAAIIGASPQQVEQVCQETGEVYPANFNSPSQIVISGLKEKVQQAAQKLKSMGAKKTVVLNVGGPFHSPYMSEVTSELEKELNNIEWKKGEGILVSNATAQLTDDPQIIKKNLIMQLSHPVLWSESMGRLVGMSYLEYIEAGPGKVLKGLFKSISKKAKVYSVASPEDIQELRASS
ncbi:MAG: ACP S-malonyltransferase [Spirochaetota bacterium]